MAEKHSRIGASSAYRWFECPGSVALSELAPPQPESPYARQGTAAHWVIEQFFKADAADKTLDVYGLVGQTAPNGYEITTEDIEAVEVFIQFVAALRKEDKYILHSETRYNLERIFKGLFGTGDLALVASSLKRLKVLDYKHGSGIPVEVVGNKQMMYYALGAVQAVCEAHKIDYLDILGWGEVFEEVEVIIVQPRCRHKDGAIRRWVIPGPELEAFARELAERAEATTKKNAVLKPGDHCRFCPALAICPEFTRNAFEIAKADFKGVSDPVNLNLPVPESLSKIEISKVLRFADIFAEWVKSVEAHALTVMERGEDMPGYKLVEKRTNRQWKDEAQAKEVLSLELNEKQLYKEPEFISPAVAEKLLGKKGKKFIEGLVVKPKGGATVAPVSDPREPIKGSAVADFEMLT